MAALMKAMAAGAQGAQAQMLAQMKFEMVINYDQWRFGDDVAADAFAFKPPADAQKVASVQEVFAAAAGGGADPAAALKGKPAPQFELELLDQEGKATLAAHKDKQIVILDFWATWCGPCVRALPILEKVAKEYKSKGVVFYAVNQREDPAQVRQFMKQREFSFNVAMDAQGRVGNLFQVQGIPQTVIIAPDGKVHEVHVGFSPNLEQTLRAELDALIEEFKPKAN
jgi:thiol-disulfide isomerase/thioredoxin